MQYRQSTPQGISRKPRLTQHLGIDPAELHLEPHIAKDSLHCDGLTDMVNNFGISNIICKSGSAAVCP